MRKVLWVFALAVVALVAYLSLWPVPIKAVAWKAPAAPGTWARMQPIKDSLA